ncbi:Bardet-Biedl syndrome 4 protein [Trypanosoma brucei equiperdum]|uniref:Bardet-Biedl syndrome 4 protein n=1 Tax=Trypanosoma brucei equiperdum TaxID=630700 RepID=A0A3L6KZ34_9TRYP|nr:Bardet-Biedl syndrome 4 protein [Trypanosoma brucei equiperdum]
MEKKGSGRGAGARESKSSAVAATCKHQHPLPPSKPGGVEGTGAVETGTIKEEVASRDKIRERRNWLIYELYVRQEYSQCCAVIDAQLAECNGTCEYALFVKGLLTRRSGDLTTSFQHFQKVLTLNPGSPACLQQLAQTSLLLGKFYEAIESFQRAEEARAARGFRKDWSLQYGVGLCYEYMREYRKAEEAFVSSMQIQRFDCTVLRLSKVLVLQKQHSRAISLLEEAVLGSPDNPDMLTVLGLLYLRVDRPAKAFNYLGRCLILNSSDSRATMAAASIMQENGEFGVALNKYRVAVPKLPSSACLWSNIGMCFFGQKNMHAAVACLRRAASLSPFEWRIAYNLGLVFLHLKQYASAFHYLSASTHLHGKYALAFMHIGVCLALMSDSDNACAAYNRAISIQDDPLIRLNYCITLVHCGKDAEARDQLDKFIQMRERGKENSQQHPQLDVGPVVPRALTLLMAKLRK